MAKMYARRVMRGDMTIDDVPKPWRDAVKEIIEQYAYSSE